MARCGRPGARTSERALKALEASGRRLIERAGGWVVALGGDRRRRPLARLSDAEARDLIAAARLREARGGGFVLAAHPDEERHETPADLAAVIAAVGQPRARGRGAGFLGLVRRARRGDGPVSLRGAAAGLRLVKDAELAARRKALTMDWNAAPSDRRRRGPSAGGLGPALEAEKRLAALKQRVGEGFALVWTVCISGAEIGAAERRFGLERRSGAERLAEELERLADAYDGVG
jgi:hypothetical protein